MWRKLWDPKKLVKVLTVPVRTWENILESSEILSNTLGSKDNLGKTLRLIENKG